MELKKFRKSKDKAALKPHEIIAARKELEGLAPTIDFSKNKVLKKAKAQRGLKQGAEVNVTSYGQGEGKVDSIRKKDGPLDSPPQNGFKLTNSS
ncbi:hypothetical protein V4HA_01789 [Lactococcus cremoris]|nr:hypothetical protein [Lactococcus cremoris]